MCKLTLLHTCLALADLKRSGRMTAVSINDVLEFMALVVLPWATLPRSWKMLVKLLLRHLGREPPRVIHLCDQCGDPFEGNECELPRGWNKLDADGQPSEVARALCACSHSRTVTQLNGVVARQRLWEWSLVTQIQRKLADREWALARERGRSVGHRWPFMDGTMARRAEDVYLGADATMEQRESLWQRKTVITVLAGADGMQPFDTSSRSTTNVVCK